MVSYFVTKLLFIPWTFVLSWAPGAGLPTLLPVPSKLIILFYIESGAQMVIFLFPIDQFLYDVRSNNCLAFKWNTFKIHP